MPLRLAEIAVRFGCELRGDPDAAVDGVAPLQDAAPDKLSFLANPRFRRHLAATRAGAVVIAPELAAECPVAALLAPNPYATYARIAQALHPEPGARAGVHVSAVVEPGARVDPSASVGALAYVASGAEIGAHAVVGPGSIVLEGAVIGAGSRLVAHVTLCREVTVGRRCLLHPGVVIGADGFGHAPDRDGYVKVPQLGRVRLGDDVEVGASTTIDRGTIDDTVIGDGVKLDNQVQVGHNVRIGAHTVIAGCTGIAGSAVIGQRCMIGGMVGISGHIEICDDVVITGRSFVPGSIRTPGVYSGGLPADEARRFRRNSARFHRLDELARRVRALEGRCGTAAGEGDDDDGG